MNMKSIVKDIANRAGFEVIRKANNHNSLDFHLGILFEKYSVDCVIDVGANTGQYGQFLRGIGYTGWIVSFEPVKSVYEKLVECAAGDVKWVCKNCALGDKAEKKVINVYSSTMFSSFLTASDYSKNIWKSLEKVNPEEVEIARLDDIISEIIDRSNASHIYLKLDTQGYDLNVLHGGLESLDKVCAVQTELSLIHVYEGMPSPYDTLNEFNSKGYLISGMYPINRDESLAVIEYDCVMVKMRIQTDG